MGIIILRMGRAITVKKGMASALFSKAQLRVLSLLFGHPDRAFHTSEIIKLAQSGTGAVQRELNKLTEAGILSATLEGNRKIYQANKHAPIFKELRQLILKTTGLVEPIRAALKRFRRQMRFAFIYGSVAKGTETGNSDVDILIVGEDLSYGEVFGALQSAEKTINRRVDPKILTLTEWKRMVSDENSFLKNIVEQEKVFIVGDDDELQRAR